MKKRPYNDGQIPIDRPLFINMLQLRRSLGMEIIAEYVEHTLQQKERGTHSIDPWDNLTRAAIADPVHLCVA